MKFNDYLIALYILQISWNGVISYNSILLKIIYFHYFSWYSQKKLLTLHSFILNNQNKIAQFYSILFITFHFIHLHHFHSLYSFHSLQFFYNLFIPFIQKTLKQNMCLIQMVLLYHINIKAKPQSICDFMYAIGIQLNYHQFYLWLVK